MRGLRIPTGGRRDHVADDRAAIGVDALVDRAAVERPAIVKGRAAGRHLDRHELKLGTGGHRLTHVHQPIVGRVEGAAERGVRPAVRARDVVDRAAVGGRVVERDPTGRHVRRIEPVQVRGVLVAQKRCPRRRLPDRVVLRHPGARQPRQRAGPAPDALGQRHCQPTTGRLSRHCTSGGSARAR